MGEWRPGDRPEKKDKEKRYYFLKLTAGFFKDKNIRKLRKMAGGDTYALITLEIFLEALENDNRLYYDGIEDTFPKELALAIDESPENVKIAVDFLLTNGWLVEETEDTFYTPKGAEMSGSISARTMRRYRAQEKEETAILSAQCPQVSALLPDDVRGVTADVRHIRDRYRTRDRDRGRVQRGGKNIHPLTELFPEAFDPKKSKVIPTVSDVADFTRQTGIKYIDPGDFYSTFSEEDWKADGVDITDWKSLLIGLELEALSEANGVAE